MFVVLMINQMYCFGFITKARKVFKVSKEKDKALELPYYDLLEALTLLKESQVQIVELATAIINDAAESKRPDEQDYLAAFSAVVSICQDGIKLLYSVYGRRDYEYIKYSQWTYEDANYTSIGLKEKYIEQELVLMRRDEYLFDFLLELFNRKDDGGNLAAGINHIERARGLHTLAYCTVLTRFANFPKTEFKKFKSTLNQTNKFYQELIKSSAGAINVQDTQDHKDIQKKLTHLGIYIEAREDGTMKA